MAVNASFFLLYAGMGGAMIINPAWFIGEGGSDPVFAGWLILGFGLALTAAGWTFGGLTAYSGRCISQQRRRTFSLIMGLINCLCVPLGTVLGVFTFITLGRPSVREIYSGESPLLFNPVTATGTAALPDLEASIASNGDGTAITEAKKGDVSSKRGASKIDLDPKKIELDLKKLEDEEEALWQEMERKARADSTKSQSSDS